MITAPGDKIVNSYLSFLFSFAPGVRSWVVYLSIFSTFFPMNISYFYNNEY